MFFEALENYNETFRSILSTLRTKLRRASKYFKGIHRAVAHVDSCLGYIDELNTYIARPEGEAFEIYIRRPVGGTLPSCRV